MLAPLRRCVGHPGVAAPPVTVGPVVRICVRVDEDHCEQCACSDRVADHSYGVAYVDGGEGEPVVVRRKRGVEILRWSPDGARLAFPVPDPQTEADNGEEDRDDAQLCGET